MNDSGSMPKASCGNLAHWSQHKDKKWTSHMFHVKDSRMVTPRMLKPNLMRWTSQIRKLFPPSHQTKALLPHWSGQLSSSSWPRAPKSCLFHSKAVFLFLAGKKKLLWTVLSNFSALAQALFLVTNWKNLSHFTCTHLTCSQWFWSPLPAGS